MLNDGVLSEGGIPLRRLNPVFFFNDTATTEIYTLSLHDALPICHPCGTPRRRRATDPSRRIPREEGAEDRKSTRLNSSHQIISYAVFCLKKKTATAKAKPELHQLSARIKLPPHSYAPRSRTTANP